MKPLSIQFDNRSVPIDRIGSDTFCVHLPDRDVRIQYQPDNEGADHWIDLDTNHETTETKQLGEELGRLLET